MKPVERDSCLSCSLLVSVNVYGFSKSLLQKLSTKKLHKMPFASFLLDTSKSEEPLSLGDMPFKTIAIAGG